MSQKKDIIDTTFDNMMGVFQKKENPTLSETMEMYIEIKNLISESYDISYTEGYNKGVEIKQEINN